MSARTIAYEPVLWRCPECQATTSDPRYHECPPAFTRIALDRRPDPADPLTADAFLALLAIEALIPVQVFGTDDCCEHGRDTDCPSTSFGLCDRFTTFNGAGSDCNRANRFLLRPSDALMSDPRVRSAFDALLDEADDDQPTKEP